MNTHSHPQPTGAAGQTALTPERIRELADIHLRRCLQSEFEARIMRGKTFCSPDRDSIVIQRIPEPTGSTQ